MRKISVLALIIILALVLVGCDGEAEEPIETVVLEISIMGNGTVQAIMENGQLENLEEGEHEVEKGSIVDIIAQPNEGHVFHAWIGPEEMYEKEASLLMNEDKDILVRFTEKHFSQEIVGDYWENGDFVVEYEITNISEEDREIAETLKIFDQNNEEIYVDRLDPYTLSPNQKILGSIHVPIKEEEGFKKGEYKAYLLNQHAPITSIGFKVE